jgi:nitrogen fixation protein NifX
MTQTGHVKVALTTNSLTEVDADFANARQIMFYDVSCEGAVFLDVKQFDPGRPDGQRGPGGGMGCSNMDPLEGETAEMLDAKIESLQGCGVLFTCKLSDFAAVRIHEGCTFPVKMEVKRAVDHVLKQIQYLLCTKPPLWLRRRLVLDPLPISA